MKERIRRDDNVIIRRRFQRYTNFKVILVNCKPAIVHKIGATSIRARVHKRCATATGVAKFYRLTSSI